jgi:hypothetical protein
VNDARGGPDLDREWLRLPVRGEARSHVVGDGGVLAMDDGRPAHASRRTDQDRDRQGGKGSSGSASTSIACCHGRDSTDERRVP